MATLTGNEDHLNFPLPTAIEWTRNYRNSVPPTETRAHYFGKLAIQTLIDQENAVGIRIYYALDEAGKKQLIIVGVDEDGNDLYNGEIAERSVPCPSVCSTASPLNS